MALELVEDTLMHANWLTKYPRAAALLQGEDEVLEYAPQEDLPEADRPDDLQPFYDRYVAPAIARQIDAAILAAVCCSWSSG